MQQKTMIMICSIVSVLGLITLFIIDISTEIEIVPIEQLDSLEGDVRFIGTITKVQNYEKVQYLTITEPCVAEVVFFKNDELGLRTNETVEVLARIDEYKGKKQIVASKIVKK